MSAGERHIALVAGAASGDKLGGQMMAALREMSPAPLRFSGFGGALMAAEGLRSSSPIEEVNFVGLAGIVKGIPRIIRHMRQTARRIVAEKPDILVIIDSPDFTHPIARFAHKRLPDMPIVNYVPPSAWFWRQGRAKRIKRYVRKSLVIFPFEPKAFRDLDGPPALYVGHPGLAAQPSADDGRRLRQKYRIPPDATALLLAPGSRRREVENSLPLFLEAARNVAFGRKNICLLLSVAPSVREHIPKTLDTGDARRVIIDDEAEKYAAFAASDGALASMGTVTMEIALAGAPLVAVYQIGRLEERIKDFVKEKSADFCAVNLVLGRRAFPEYIGRNLSASRIADDMRNLLFADEALKAARRDLEELRRSMNEGLKDTPARNAARAILSMLDLA